MRYPKGAHDILENPCPEALSADEWLYLADAGLEVDGLYLADAGLEVMEVSKNSEEDAECRLFDWISEAYDERKLFDRHVLRLFRWYGRSIAGKSVEYSYDVYRVLLTKYHLVCMRYPKGAHNILENPCPEVLSADKWDGLTYDGLYNDFDVMEVSKPNSRKKMLISFDTEHYVPGYVDNTKKGRRKRKRRAIRPQRHFRVAEEDYC
jgi:hypothetical protein